MAFDHTLRGKGLGRLSVDNPALRQAASVVLHAIRTDRLGLCVASGWVLLPPRIAASLSPLPFDLERRVLNRYPPARTAGEAAEHGVHLVAAARLPPPVRPDTPGAATWTARGFLGPELGLTTRGGGKSLKTRDGFHPRWRQLVRVHRLRSLAVFEASAPARATP
jgi:hypothetical protein